MKKVAMSTVFVSALFNASIGYCFPTSLGCTSVHTGNGTNGCPIYTISCTANFEAEGASYTNIGQQSAQCSAVANAAHNACGNFDQGGSIGEQCTSICAEAAVVGCPVGAVGAFTGGSCSNGGSNPSCTHHDDTSLGQGVVNTAGGLLGGVLGGVRVNGSTPLAGVAPSARHTYHESATSSVSYSASCGCNRNPTSSQGGGATSGSINIPGF